MRVERAHERHLAHCSVHDVQRTKVLLTFYGRRTSYTHRSTCGLTAYFVLLTSSLPPWVGPPHPAPPPPPFAFRCRPALPSSLAPCARLPSPPSSPPLRSSRLGQAPSLPPSLLRGGGASVVRSRRPADPRPIAGTCTGTRSPGPSPRSWASCRRLHSCAPRRAPAPPTAPPSRFLSRRIPVLRRLSRREK